jgi:hypothetical protein
VFLREKEIHSFFFHIIIVFFITITITITTIKYKHHFHLLREKGICNLSTHHTISKIIEMSDYFITLFFIY